MGYKKGDLVDQDDQLEVKAFSSIGPMSFGPTEEWDRLYIIDCIKFKDFMFKVYEVNLSNNEKAWKDIQLNTKGETIGSQSAEKRRPRLSPNKLIESLPPNSYKIIFDDNLHSLC